MLRSLAISGVFSTAVDPVRDQFDAGMNVKSECLDLRGENFLFVFWN